MQYYDVSEPKCTVMYILPSWPKEVLIKVVINKTNLGYWYLGSWTGPYFSEEKKSNGSSPFKPQYPRANSPNWLS